jgi:transglutaminase superfamily protein
MATARIDLPTLRAAWWTLRAARQTRVALARQPLEKAMATVPTAPRLPEHAGRGVHAVLRRRGDTCLVQAIVLQAWEAAQGHSRDLVIGVTSPRAEAFRAHAWLDGDLPCHELAFSELLRRPPP